MREILFRGKRDDNGEWVEGNLFIPDYPDKPTEICIGTNVVRIIYEVYPETVGMYTGKKDKNNKKIFTKDIVKAWLHNETPMIFPITFRAGCFWYGNWNFCEFLDKFRNIEVIGNVFDNPELLK